MPLFSNDERALIGIAYAEEGRGRATRMGLDMVGPRMNQMLDDLKEVVSPGPVLVHCWRGGMRSESVAWLLNFSGEFEACTLQGGYKAFRQLVLAEFSRRRSIVILGGMTGSGKTEILKELRGHHAQVIDLEGIASHKGSAFGSIGLTEQPTQQQFENELGVALLRSDPSVRLWLEDESRRIGRCMLPKDLWSAMREAPCIVLQRPREERRAHLVADYGRADSQALTAAISRIERRLGSERARQAIDSVMAGEMETACEILLDYYDKMYSYGLGQRDPSNIFRYSCQGISAEGIAGELNLLADEVVAEGRQMPVPSES